MYNCVTRIEMEVETLVLSPFTHLTRLLARHSLLDCNLLGNIVLQCVTDSSEIRT